ncbi:hypothetical protein AXF42_Ash007969 [Apostasia shenzhenica]|uniref:Uncharacterized protein n=1 Tax=Apostasia shenzhenica TaxID=1088818 RepID=A0A2I0B5U5_9ASPA|nr:hypothetical protein AXF42_Ash007969 [Apostasia shenzhenica]
MGVHHCRLLPPSMKVSSFSGDIYRLSGYATLRVTLEDGPRKETRQVDFIIIDAPSGYNAILGWPAIAAFCMVPSTFHLCIKFPTPLVIATIRGDGAGAKKCFEISARLYTDHLDPREHALPSADQYDYVTIANGKSILICKDYPENKKPALAALLSEYFDVFAWGPKDMPGIKRNIAEHQLTLKPDATTIRQKKRSFGGKKQQAIKEEVKKLLAAGFIKEIAYPS